MKWYKFIKEDIYTMKWYKYWKVYIGIGIFLVLCAFTTPEESFGVIPDIIIGALLIYFGITQRKKA